MSHTAITLFAYNRPIHTEKTVASLLECKEASSFDFIVFCDGPKDDSSQVQVDAVRTFLNSITGFKSVKIIASQVNKGLAASIISGVTEVLNDYKSIIVLEDDMIVSPHFLTYMIDGLEKYQNDDRVISIHGYVYPVKEELPETFFLRGADCWGWATWRRGWNLFNPDGQFLLDELDRRNLREAFDFNGSFSYSGMLQGQINGINDSWAVRWYASAFLENKLTLYPGRSLVHNIGNDSSGTHCGKTIALDTKLSDRPICITDNTVKESGSAKKAIELFFRRNRLPLQILFECFKSVKMRHQLTALAKDFLPLFAMRKLRHFLRRDESITFEGPFASWEEANERSSGYADEQILKKVLAATLKVKNGEAVFERDSVLFDKIQYSWSVTAALMWSAARNDGMLNVLDFGGSLGSSYFQNRKFLDGLQGVRWSVVEQAKFYEAGREHIQDERLVFYPTIAECVAVEKPNVVLLSSVLQYLPDPYAFLDELVESGADLILIDLTIVNSKKFDRIFIQNVPKSIYEASYPVRSLSEEKLISSIERFGYNIIADFKTLNFPQLKKLESQFKGFIFSKKYE